MTELDLLPALTIDRIQEIFPIARSDRRQNADLFQSWIDKSGIKDDAQFYPVLATLLAQTDPVTLRDYDIRMCRKCKPAKAFGHRAYRYLRSRTAEPIELKDLLEGGEDLFVPGTPEAAVLDLLIRLMPRPAGEGGDSEGVKIPDQQTGSDWKALATELIERAEALTEPDVAAAGDILGLADGLVAACREAAQQHDLDSARAVLADRLAELDPALTGYLPETMSAKEIADVEVTIAAVAACEAELKAARTDAERLKACHDTASEIEDFEKVVELIVLRKQATDRRQVAQERRETANLELANRLGMAERSTEVGNPPTATVETWTSLQSDGGQSTVGQEDAAEGKSANPSGEIAESEPLEIYNPTDEAAAVEVQRDAEQVQTEVIDPPDTYKPSSSGAVSAPDGSADRSSAALGAGTVANIPDLVHTSSAKTPNTLLSSEEALALHLSQGNIVFSWYLAKLSLDAAETPPIPPVVIEALVWAPSVHGPEDLADPHHVGLLAEMMGALPDAGDPDAAVALALAALIRPALFSPDSSAREHVGNLPRDGELAVCSPLIEALATLGYHVRVTIEDLADLAGRERSQRLPAAKDELRSWLENTLQRKCMYVPTYRILHRELKPEGEIGRVIEAAIADRLEAVAATELLVQKFSDPAQRETFIVDCEKRTGRPAKDRIEGAARAWFSARLAETGDVLRNWLEARRADTRTGAVGDKDALASSLGALRKAVGATRKSLAKGWTEDGSLRFAARSCLLAALNDLFTLLEGQSTSAIGSRTQKALFEAPLLRLPSGCQDWTDGDTALADERKTRDTHLLEALRTPDAVAQDEHAAFVRHLSASAILPAHALIAQMRASDLEEGALRELNQELEEVLLAARTQALGRIARLQQGLTTLAYLDVDASERQRGSIAQLASIAEALSDDRGETTVTLPALSGVRVASVPPDFPELDTLLGAIEANRDHLRARIRDTQLSALNDLIRDPRVSASANAFAEAIDRIDPVMIDDALADLRGGRPVSLPKPDQDNGFTRFFPALVREIESMKPPRGAVIAAAQAGERIGPLDFSVLDSVTCHRARQILETWGKAENALKAGKSNKQRELRDALVELFGLFELTSVQVDSDRLLIPGRLRSLQLSCNRWRSKRWFISPAYGSAAGGQYPLIVARDTVSADQIEGQLAEIGRDRPCLVLYFGRLDVAQRRSLTRILRREHQQALVLDETLMLHVAAEKAQPLETILTAASPFGWLQPYDTSAGGAAPEMFVGRTEEIRTITAQSAGGSLIYGGRQLGKSALMDRIRQESHRPDEGKLAFLLEIKPIGGPGRPASDLWGELASSLRTERSFARIGAAPDEVISALSQWLSEKPDRRVIAMFDEADNFLRAEHAADYPNLDYFKQLMQEMRWRFKVVFAGLHNVRRMSRAPNSPLPHLGEPVCIGPMNQTSENRAALRWLATEPLRAAGFDYAEPELVSEMLARVNYYPSLVQVFGQRVIETMGRRAEIPGTGPRWRLGREVLFEGEAAGRIAEDIRNRFQWTLNLDRRYELIAKSIALQRIAVPGGDHDVLGGGMTVAEIEALVVDWWPQALPRPSRDDLAELLSEMVDLGVLARYGTDRFGLRNAQVAQMLGDRDRLETDILSLSEQDGSIDYDAALFHRSLAPALPDERAPLPDRKLQALFDHATPGLRFVGGSAAVNGDRLADRVAASARQWTMNSSVEIVSSRGPLRETVERLAKSGGVLIIAQPWDETAADWLTQQTSISDGRLLPIWVQSDCSVPTDVPAMCFHAGSWSELMLRHWMLEEGLLVYDDRETLRALVEATGAAPARVMAIKSVLMRHAAEPLVEQRRAIETWAAENPLPATAVGLEPAFAESLVSLVTIATEDDPLPADELNRICRGASQELLTLELAVSDRYDHLTPTPLGRLVAAGTA